MTREEALNILHNASVYHPDYLDALNMAIEALEQEPCEDCISRQAVIDCFKKWQPYMATRLHEFENELFELPSVKPTQNISIQITEREKYGRFN